MRWLVYFFLGLSMPEDMKGKTGRREVASVLMTVWVLAAWRLSYAEAAGKSVVHSMGLLHGTSWLVFGCFLVAFGFKGLTDTGVLDRLRRPTDVNKQQNHHRNEGNHHATE